MAYRICSISGGGVRGIVPATIIKEMLTISKNKGGTGQINDLCDYVVGTSVGGIVGAGLVVSEDGQTPKFNPDTVLGILRDHASEIFPEDSNALQQKTISLVAGVVASGLFTAIFGLSLGIAGAVGVCVGALTFSQSSHFDGLFAPKYSREGIDRLLENNFGNLTLTDVIIPFTTISYSLEQNNPRVWSTLKADKTTKDNLFIKDALGATSAAPTYFPHKVTKITLESGKEELYYDIDGGIFANSPVNLAISVLEKHASQKILSKVKSEGVVVLSLGTGYYNNPAEFVPPTSFQESKLGYGLFKPLVFKVMEAAEKDSIIQARNVYNAMRLDPILDESLIPMDKSDDAHINSLSGAAGDFVNGHRKIIEQYTECLIDTGKDPTWFSDNSINSKCEEMITESHPDYSYESYGFMLT